MHGVIPRVLGLALVVLLAASGMPSHAQGLRQLTDLIPDGFAGWSVDDAGTVVVAVWKGDPLGTNPSAGTAPG